MKKILVLAAVVSAFSFASCKKDHSCTCTTTSSTTEVIVTDWQTSATETETNTYSGTGTGVVIINDAKKKDAKKACIDSNEEDVDVNVYEGYDWISGEDYTETTTTTTKDETVCDLK